MGSFKDILQVADWKIEKHVPAIEAPDKINKGAVVKITVCVGKEIPHPNTTAHYIRSIELYFFPEGEKFPYQLARFESNAHGESIQGPDTSTIYSEPYLTAVFKTAKSGTIMATSYCNIHGVWKSEKELIIE